MKSRAKGGRATLAAIGEDVLVSAILGTLPQGPGTIVGGGDDCAAVESPARGEVLLLKCDAMVEGIHFTKEAAPEKVGRKALARCLSDIAAMAGRPREALVTLAVPGSLEMRWVAKFYNGLNRLARQHEVSVVGGETVECPGPSVISVSLTGSAPRNGVVTRSGGRPGDVLLVTGRLGGSLKGHHFDFEPRLAEARWLARRFRPSAMMDLSDGLAADLPRLATASACGYELDKSAVPRSRGSSIGQALNDGEDFELLIAMEAKRARRCVPEWSVAFPNTLLTAIGRLTAAGEMDETRGATGGYRHFQKSR